MTWDGQAGAEAQTDHRYEPKSSPRQRTGFGRDRVQPTSPDSARRARRCSSAPELRRGHPTKGITDTPGGLKLQCEGHDVRYRNVWIQEVDLVRPNTDFKN